VLADWRQIYIRVIGAYLC